MTVLGTGQFEALVLEQTWRPGVQTNRDAGKRESVRACGWWERRGEEEVKGHTEVLAREMGCQVVAFPETGTIRAEEQMGAVLRLVWHRRPRCRGV